MTIACSMTRRYSASVSRTTLRPRDLFRRFIHREAVVWGSMKSGGRVEVLVPSLYQTKIVSSSWDWSGSAVGYYHNVYVTVPEQDTSTLDTAICAAVAAPTVVVGTA